MSGALRRAAVAAVLVVVSSAVALGAVELLLRARPQLLGRAFANGVLSKYTDGAGGIYYKDRLAQTRFMIPNFTTRMYANGYVWTHQTDALGFRNRTLSIPSDIVLLGGSYIYGHGLDFDSTVGAILEGLTGMSVANLARQGDGPLQQAYLVTEFMPCSVRGTSSTSSSRTTSPISTCSWTTPPCRPSSIAPSRTFTTRIAWTRRKPCASARSILASARSSRA